MEKQQSKRFFLSSAIRKFDSYGHPVNLSLDGQPTYKTFIGGIATLISTILIISYFIYEIMGVINKESQIKTTVENRNLVTDNTIYNINETQFDLAIKISFKSGNETRQKRYQRYTNFFIFQSDQHWEDGVNGNNILAWNKTIKEISRCPKTRFANATEFTSEIGLYESFVCVEDMNFQLQGSMSSAEAKQMWLTFDFCNQTFLDFYFPGETCEMDPQEVRNVLSDMEITLVLANQYFDGNEFKESPIKWDYRIYFFSLHPDISNIMYYKVSQNYVIKQTSILYETYESQETFLSHSFCSYQFHEVSVKDYPYLAFGLTLDEASTSFQRNTKTVLEAISNTGGIIGFIISTVGFTIKFFQDFYFNQAILQRIFLYQKKSGKQIKNEIDIVKLRVPFRIKFRHYCRNTFPLNYCRGKNNLRGQKKYELYKIGIQALNKEFDISYLVKQIRLLKQLSKVFLSKYQRKLLPYFKKNLIEEFRPLETACDDKFSKYLEALIQKSSTGYKKDKRILAHLLNSKPDSSELQYDEIHLDLKQGLSPAASFQREYPQKSNRHMQSVSFFISHREQENRYRDNEMNLESSIQSVQDIDAEIIDKVIQGRVAAQSQIKKGLEF